MNNSDTQKGEEKEHLSSSAKSTPKTNAAKSPKTVMDVGKHSFDGEPKDSTPEDKNDVPKSGTRTSPRKKASPHLNSSEIADKSPGDTTGEKDGEPAPATQGKRTNARRASKTAAIRSLFGGGAMTEDTTSDKSTASPTKKSPPSSPKKPKNKSIPKAKSASSSPKRVGASAGVGTWTDKECRQFEKGVTMHGWGSWKNIEHIVPTRGRTQIKSHAQKFEKHYPEKVKMLKKEYEANLKGAKAAKIPRGTKRQQVKAEKEKKLTAPSPTAKTTKKVEAAKKPAAPPAKSKGAPSKKRAQESKANARRASPTKRAKWGLRVKQDVDTPSEVTKTDEDPKASEPKRKKTVASTLQHPQKRQPKASAKKRALNAITKSRYDAAASSAILEPTAKKGKGLSQSKEVMGKGTEAGNGKWTSEEHKKFEKACIKHGWGNWSQMLMDIPTRTKDQIKTHAQKLKKDYPEEMERLQMEHDWLIQQEKMNWSPAPSPARPAMNRAAESDDEISELELAEGNQGILKQGSTRSSRRSKPKHVLIMSPPGSPAKSMKSSNDTPPIRSPGRTTAADLGAAEAIMTLFSDHADKNEFRLEQKTNSLPESEGADEEHDIEEKKPRAKPATKSDEAAKTKGVNYYYNNFMKKKPAVVAPATIASKAQAAPMPSLPTTTAPIPTLATAAAPMPKEATQITLIKPSVAAQKIKNGYIVQWSKMNFDPVKLLDYCRRLNAEGENVDVSPADAILLRQRLHTWLDRKYPFEPFPSHRFPKQKPEKAKKAEVDGDAAEQAQVKTAKWEKDKEIIRNGYISQWARMEYHELWDYCRRLNAEGETIDISASQTAQLRNRLQSWLDNKYPLEPMKSNEEAVVCLPTSEGVPKDEATTVKGAPSTKKTHNGMKQPPPHWLAAASWRQCTINIQKWNSELSPEEQAEEIKKYKKFTSKQKEELRIRLVTLMGNRDLPK